MKLCHLFARSAMRLWDDQTCVRNSQNSCFCQTSLLYPNLKFRPPKRRIALNKKSKNKSIFKQTLQRWTNMLMDQLLAYWVKNWKCSFFCRGKNPFYERGMPWAAQVKFKSVSFCPNIFGGRVGRAGWLGFLRTLLLVKRNENLALSSFQSP